MTTARETAAKPVDPSLEELRHDIEQHRAELAASVDALAGKLDVKSKLRARAVALRPVLLPAGGGAALLTVLLLVRKRRSRGHRP